MQLTGLARSTARGSRPQVSVSRGSIAKEKPESARDHPFFIGTLFLPQFSSTPESPHPLIVAFVGAAAHFHQA